MSSTTEKFKPRRIHKEYECCGEIECVWNDEWYKHPTVHGCMKYTTLDACVHVETIGYLESIGYKEDFSKLKVLQAIRGI